MSRSKYFIIVAGLFLGTTFLLSTHGEPVFADDGDYFGNPDFFTPPPSQTYTYTDWENETYGYSWSPIQYLQPLQPLEDIYGFGASLNNTSAANVQSGNPDVTQTSFSSVQSGNVTQTEAPPNSAFQNIMDMGGFHQGQVNAASEMPTVSPNNGSADVAQPPLPPGWGVAQPLGNSSFQSVLGTWGFLGPQTVQPAEAPINVAANDVNLKLSKDITMTDVNGGLLQDAVSQAAPDARKTGIDWSAGSSASRPAPVSSVDAVVDRNFSGYLQSGNSIGSRSSQVSAPVVPSLTTSILEAIKTYAPAPVSDFVNTVTGRNSNASNNASILQLNGVSQSSISGKSGVVDFSANWRPGNVYFQVGCKIYADFTCVK